MNSMKIISRTLVSLLCFAALSISGRAQLVTYEFTGTIKNATPTTLAYFGAASTFTASVVLDSAAAPFYSGPGGVGVGGQETNTHLVSMSLTVHTVANGDWTATSNSVNRNVYVLNDTSSLDRVQFSAAAVSASSFSSLTPNSFNLYFAGDNSLLSSTDIPLASALSPSIWDPSHLGTQTYMKVYLNGGSELANFYIESVSDPAAVPEPSTCTVVAGLFVLGIVLRRRRVAS
jgi:hypothetical protein